MHDRAFLVDSEYMSLDIIVYIVRFYGIDAPIGVIRRHSSFFRSSHGFTEGAVSMKNRRKCHESGYSTSQIYANAQIMIQNVNYYRMKENKTKTGIKLIVQYKKTILHLSRRRPKPEKFDQP